MDAIIDFRLFFSFACPVLGHKGEAAALYRREVAAASSRAMEKPALSLSAVPGRRAKLIAVAQEAEKRGFAGIYSPSLGDCVAFCQSIAAATDSMLSGTSIANIYARHASDYAQTAAFIHEVSGGRFLFGVGVSHEFFNASLGLKTGKPLSDMRAFVETYKKSEKRVGPLPPLVLATLRKKMLRLAGEVAGGAVWANAACSHMQESLAELPADKRNGDFFIGNMVPTCVSEDREAAANVLRRVLRMYVQLPNYQNYWIEAGYEEEMTAIRSAVANGEKDRLDSLMPERWLRDVTLYGSAAEVREGVQRWYDAGVSTPILVPSSVNGGQLKAVEEVMSVFD